MDFSDINDIVARKNQIPSYYKNGVPTLKKELCIYGVKCKLRGISCIYTHLEPNEYLGKNLCRDGDGCLLKGISCKYDHPVTKPKVQSTAKPEKNVDIAKKVWELLS